MDMRVCTLAVTGFERSSKLSGTAEWEQIQLHYSVYFRQARSPLDIVWTSTFYTWLYSHRFMSIVSVLYIQSFASWYSLGKKINVQLNLNSALGALPVSRRVKISKSREHFSSSPPESFKGEWCTENHTQTHLSMSCCNVCLSGTRAMRYMSRALKMKYTRYRYLSRICTHWRLLQNHLVAFQLYHIHILSVWSKCP